MKIDRLISILVVLIRRGHVKASELAEMFDVSVRTILRDIDTLNLAGIPIVTSQGINGGIGILEGYHLDKSMLTSEDMAAIITALKGVAGTLPDRRNEVLVDKFKSILSSSQLDDINAKTSRLIIDLSPWGGNGPVQERLKVIRNAIEDRKELEFQYTDSENKKTVRKVEPYSLILKGQKWYLYAWCLMRQGFRFFRLSRMRDISVPGTYFTPREIGMEQPPWEKEWQKPDNMVELELVFEKGMEDVVFEWFGEDACVGGDGTIMVKSLLPENNWLYGFILSFGTGVEVVNPPHLRDIVARIAEGIYKKYL